MQQEFAIEIPDEEADEIKTVQQGTRYCVMSSRLLTYGHSYRLYCKDTRRYAYTLFARQRLDSHETGSTLDLVHMTRRSPVPYANFGPHPLFDCN